MVSKSIIVSKYSERRKDEMLIYHKYDYSKKGHMKKCQEEIDQYHIRELLDFIKKYPKYENIIK